MHSSRMRTARSSSRSGGLHQAPLRTRHPLGPGIPPGPDTPKDQAPPGPGTPLGPDPHLGPAPPGPGTPPRPGTPPDQTLPGPDTPWTRHPPVNILPCPKLRLRAVNIDPIAQNRRTTSLTYLAAREESP